MILLCAFALALAETIARRGARDPARWGAPGTAMSLASGLALLGTTIAAATAAGAPARTPWLGLAPVLAGIALRFAAMRELGDAFTSEAVFVPGRPVARSGLYRWTRHPSDLGLVLYAFGIAALGASALAFVFAGVAMATTLLRIVTEERSRSAGG